MSAPVHKPGPSHPPYVVGLLLLGRPVVVVGGGRVAARRVGTLVESGAAVTVVSPGMHPDLLERRRAGEVTLVERAYRSGDLDGAWYAMAATDRPGVNAAVAQEADERRIFCVRADEALAGSAWTPASGQHGEITVAVLANRDPARSASTRDALLATLREGCPDPRG